MYQGDIEYVENGAGILETRETEGLFALELLNSDILTATYVRDYELIPQPFAIDATVTTIRGSDYLIYSGGASFTPTSLYIAPLGDPWTLCLPTVSQ